MQNSASILDKVSGQEIAKHLVESHH